MSLQRRDSLSTGFHDSKSIRRNGLFRQKEGRVYGKKMVNVGHRWQRLKWRGWGVLLVVLPMMLGSGFVPAGAEDGFSGGLYAGSGASQKVKVEAYVTRLLGVDKPVLVVKASVEPGWHIYSLTQGPGGPVPTKISVLGPEGIKLAGRMVVFPDPETHREAAFPDILVESHEGSVHWAGELEVSHAPGDLKNLVVEGSFLAQPCDANSCLPPRSQRFSAKYTESPPIEERILKELAKRLQAATLGGTEKGTPGGRGPAKEATESQGQKEMGTPRGEQLLPWQPFSLERFKQFVGPEFNPDQLRITLFNQSSSLWYLVLQMAAGFVGGILLNVMPCVLPVIGLKLFAFMQQAGESRWKAFWLNVWYSIGLLSVFALLAALAITLQFGWGHLFRLAGFNVVMAAVVFAMALAFLGIWTIPIPGFVGSGRAAELAEKEGVLGAFFKGVFTTFLATPCTGPFMGSALAWAFTQPPLTVFLVFMSVGLGMASPYLVVGLFPELIRFLPKPGPWMEVFERVMGFVLLGTVLFILTFLDWPYIVPTVGLLFAIWAACWWVERAAMTGITLRKVRAWVGAVGFVVLAWLLLFPGIPVQERRIGGLLRVMEERFRERVQELALRESGPQLQSSLMANQVEGNSPGKSGGFTVLVDCTADWCLTCKTLEATVLNSRPVREALRENRVVLLKADWTHEAPEVTQFLKWLGFQQVPVIAIFPADRPNEPIIFTGWYTQGDILRALQEAGPSRNTLLPGGGLAG
ncbi:protein-disulfide reductase DsbD family protein [Thermogutta sp.]|uniref:protein-disulfide reductase DsbD family protein n=1 Tax=Thermogutta sp. TaxID=1962930 RepID=UPI003C7A1A65